MYVLFCLKSIFKFIAWRFCSFCISTVRKVWLQVRLFWRYVRLFLECFTAIWWPETAVTWSERTHNLIKILMMIIPDAKARRWQWQETKMCPKEAIICLICPVFLSVNTAWRVNRWRRQWWLEWWLYILLPSSNGPSVGGKKKKKALSLCDASHSIAVKGRLRRGKWHLGRAKNNGPVVL